MLQKGEELAKKGIITTLEFSTYFLNKESFAMAKKDGFKLAKRFYYVQKPLGEKVKPKRTKIESLDELDYKDYIPYGWKFLHKCKESLEWLNKKTEIREYGGLKFLYAPMHETEPTFAPFKLSVESIETLLPAMSFEAEKMGL